jgi:nicotinamidase-related amidase
MSIRPPQPALLLIDVVDGFLAPHGSLYYPDAKAVVEPLRQLRDTARAAGRLIVYARDHHRAGLFDFENLHVELHLVIGEADTVPFGDFVPADTPNEIAIPKRRYSAFYGTDLDMLLREQNVDRVVIAGVKTNVCLRSTVQDAFAAGYKVLVPRAATNSNRAHLAEASLEDIEHYFGRVVDLDEALDVLRADEPAAEETEP